MRTTDLDNFGVLAAQAVMLCHVRQSRPLTHSHDLLELHAHAIKVFAPLCDESVTQVSLWRTATA